MLSLDLLLEVIMETFYYNTRKRILQKVNISAATVGFGLAVLILRRNTTELAMPTQSLGIPRGRM